MVKSVKKATLDIAKIDDENITENSKLKFWKDRYQESLNAYNTELSKIDEAFEIYEGSSDIYNTKGVKSDEGTSSVRKVAFELIEAQADVVVPMPKVRSLSGNEKRAMTIEHFIMNELDRLPMENIVDAQARTTPIAGAAFTLVEWDNSVVTRNTVGNLKVTDIDPKNVIPQKGVFEIDDMDYIFLRLEQSKSEIKRNYNVDLEKLRILSQDEPDMDESNNNDLVTHVFCYYKNDNGEISLYSWVNDTEIINIDNYFARKEYVCTKCGNRQVADSDECECGNDKFEVKDLNNQKIKIQTPESDPATGEPTGKFTDVEIDVPYYVPKTYPIIKRVNISKRQSFLGVSDVEMIRDQQNDLNILMAKIKEKLLKGGSVMTIPERIKFKATNDEMQIVPVKNMAEKELIDIKTLQPNIQNDMGILGLNYDIARQTIGVTNSYQGREDSSALSGKAKEASVSQVEGRFEPKKTMKNSSFGSLFRVMFQFMLAYADEPRTVYYQDEYGQMQYKMFDKRMFIDKDESGKYYYDDEYAFATDISSTLANNRQLMWQETRNNFASGAYGDPTDVGTLVMYWQMMETLHYPGATQALQFATKRQQEQIQAQQQEMQMKQQQQDMQIKAATENSQAKMLDSQSKAIDAKTKQAQMAQSTSKQSTLKY